MAPDNKDRVRHSEKYFFWVVRLQFDLGVSGSEVRVENKMRRINYFTHCNGI